MDIFHLYNWYVSIYRWCQRLRREGFYRACFRLEALSPEFFFLVVTIIAKVRKSFAKSIYLADC